MSLLYIQNAVCTVQRDTWSKQVTAPQHPDSPDRRLFNILARHALRDS